jgi:hypothetical protein
MCEAWAEMVVDATPSFHVVHLKRHRANDIQSYCMLAHIAHLATVGRQFAASEIR